MHIIFDFEVFAYDWIVVFKSVELQKYYVIHNDNAKFQDFINNHPDDIFYGFNIKHYDNYIAKAILNDADVTTVKNVNDFIIGGNEGYKHYWLSTCKNITYNFSDLMDDMQVGLSLKSIEAHLGMNIEESEVDFTINRNLTPEELKLTIQYCKFDVDATEKLYSLRKAYLDNKIMVGKMSGLTEAQSLKLTNAKLTAEYLQASPVTTNDERTYVYPDNLLKEYIPQEVFDFYNRMYNPDISDDELFHTKYVGNIGKCEYTLGFGGIHGDCGNCIIDATDNDIEIINEDVGGYYPHLITVNGYCSRAMSHPEDYATMLEQRMKAKASGDKVTANALKLVCNTTYGAYGDKYNKLYDPLMMRSVCISGQLYLLELAQHCYKETNCDIIQLNTDGIMLAVKKSLLPMIETICDEWQKRTGFDLEKDEICKVVQKDVNNYCEIKSDGSFKCKGGYLVRGISSAGAFNINNNFPIVAEAVTNYFTKGILPERTILDCEDIFKFQIIAKASSKYSKAYHEIDGEDIEVQRCNRVYATNNTRYGKLYKIHKETGKASKIASLPEHCIVDNKNELTIDDVYKNWYISLAWKYITDYLGDDYMAAATTKKTSIYEKLMIARMTFGKTEKKKSGTNSYAEFKYYELSDIVPIATQIFTDLGLAFITTFEDNCVIGKLVDWDSKDSIEFKIPFTTISEPGKLRQHEVMAMGSTITYFRRYCYMAVLDIVEPDAFDSGMFENKKKEPEKYVPQNTKKAPASAEERKEIKEELTSANEQADEEHIIGLKSALKTLKTLDPSQEDEIQKIVVSTNSFKNLTNEKAEELIKYVGEKIIAKRKELGE